MREIKFRAWHKAEKRFINLNGMSTEFGTMTDKGQVYGITEQGVLREYDIDEIELMQYTDLKDKNGKEIFEGDIVKPFTDDINIAQIIYLAPKFVIATKKKDGSYLLWNYLKDEIEIIGNIHQDKNLLK